VNATAKPRHGEKQGCGKSRPMASTNLFRPYNTPCSPGSGLPARRCCF